MIFYFLFILLLAVSCVHVPDDPLVEMTQDVMKKKEG